MKKLIIERRPYSDNPKDDYLEYVLAKIENRFTPYVTWIYNKSFEGFVDGNYHTSLKEAVDDFYTRGERR